MSIVYAEPPDDDTAEIRALITRLERIQSIGGGLLSNATYALRIARGLLPDE